MELNRKQKLHRYKQKCACKNHKNRKYIDTAEICKRIDTSRNKKTHRATLKIIKMELKHEKKLFEKIENGRNALAKWQK